MRKRTLFILSIMVLFLSVFSLAVPEKAIAEKLPDGIVIGDEQGLKARKNGDYFVNVTDVLPGKKWTKQISLLNIEEDSSYTLTMLVSSPVTSGSLDLSKALQMTIRYEGETLYEGPASGQNANQNLQVTPLYLGVFNGGDSRSLEVDYSLSDRYTNQDFVRKNSMDNVWTFYAIKTPDGSSVKDKNSSFSVGMLPRTGEELKRAMVFFSIGIALVLLVILFLRKKWTVSQKE